MQYLSLDFIGIFTLLAGFIIGLGAVTVIDLHGFLGRKSAYWTEATTRTHKVTKPLIWIGMFLAITGGIILYRNTEITNTILFHIITAVIMILNGIFLSFSVSPFLLKKEKEGKAGELLPKSWQIKITISFIISFICWWGNLALVVYHLSTNI
ncbi:MAG: hypothetical protein KBC12_03145 [Candidatus Pacebacteria bacterium]|nr:hypothetical protein [Candidatus Paceibacterota bacterium]MBP9851305.1 hypothetical protein [Candidatus Paceibacterota bacterium]